MDTETIKLEVRLQRTPCQAGPARQAGSIMVVFVISLAALVGMVGYVADIGHLYVNKDRLQSAMDATALSAAMTLNLISNNNNISCGQMITDANATLASFKQTDGNGELSHISGLTYEVATVLAGPYSVVTSGSDCTAKHFVRVYAQLTGLQVFFLQVVTIGTGGGITKETAASAVAGPERCPVNIVPVGVCALNNDAPPTPESPSLDCPDANGKCYGYTTGVETCIKPGAGTSSDFACDPNNTSGWFNWLAVNGNGASNLAAQLAYQPGADPNNPNYCPQLNQDIDLEPGNIPSEGTREAWNRRFDPGYLPSDISSVPSKNTLTNCWRGDLALCVDSTSSSCTLNATQKFLNAAVTGGTPNPDNCVWDMTQTTGSDFNELSYTHFPFGNGSEYPLGLITTPPTNPAQAPRFQVNGNDVDQYATGVKGQGSVQSSLYAGFAAAWTGSGTATPLNQYTSARMVVTPVMDCTGVTNTSVTPPVIGYMCAFITREIPKDTGITNRITVEFTGSCGNAPRFPIRMVLYKNIASGDS